MAARSTMYSLIRRVRDLTTAGVADYSVGAVTYWSDDQIQDALDRNRLDVIDEPLSPLSTVNAGGTTEYKHYQSQYPNWEQTSGGTAVYVLRDGTGVRVGTASYTPDYERGRIEFASSVTGGSVLYLSGQVYDVYAAAGDVWRQKAAHVAERFDFSADGASFKASQLIAQYERMARSMEGKASFGESGVKTVSMYRDDVVVAWDS